MPESFTQFDTIIKKIKSLSGLTFPGATKKQIYVFLEKIAEDRRSRLGFDDSREYMAYLNAHADTGEWKLFLGRSAIHRTRFFRQPSQWKFLESRLREKDFSAERNLRIWSAGCSTGEEPYTLAMILKKQVGLSRNWEIVATDLDPFSLDAARAGIYSKRAVSADVHRSYLEDGDLEPINENASWFRVNRQLATRVKFRCMNLCSQRWPQDRFDYIFCRNVLFYFDDAKTAEILRRFQSRIKPGGFLFVSKLDGHVHRNIGEGWIKSGPWVYRCTKRT